MATPLYHYVSPIIYRGKVAPNLLARIQLPSEAINNRLLFHRYVVADGDRPDTIAYHYYGSDNYDWVVLLSNQIIHLNNDWPLTQAQFDAAITAKYGSIATAMGLIVGYEINPNLGNISDANYQNLPEGVKRYFTRVATSANNKVWGITKDKIRISASSYAAIPAGEAAYWQPIYAYDDETRINDDKRVIRLIDARYVPQLENTLRQISKNVTA